MKRFLSLANLDLICAVSQIRASALSGSRDRTDHVRKRADIGHGSLRTMRSVYFRRPGLSDPNLGIADVTAGRRIRLTGEVTRNKGGFGRRF
jgi:hypothetical protein